MNIKSFIVEEIEKLHKLTLLKEKRSLIENKLKLLSEESGYYPAGAEHDSRAPWNDTDDPEDDDADENELDDEIKKYDKNADFSDPYEDFKYRDY